MITTREFIEVCEIRNHLLIYDELRALMLRLGISLQSRVVSGFKLTCYLTATDVRQLLAHLGIRQ